ncbi:uncharacterized protein LOC134330606 isoform X2 [Trichomycterus rosablanca]|uniref:uncharacterized protein LOC134330606 isoform X2 n=1 Tax=Trichomycterus rosablanca TaxID=2290929 RepID=UPI002F35D859
MMGRLKHCMRASKIKAVVGRGKRKVGTYNCVKNRSMTPLRTSNRQSHLKNLRTCLLSPVNESDYTLGRVLKTRGGSISSRTAVCKDLVTHSDKDPSQDSTSMIMPSGVSSFLLDCMDSDLEADVTLPSIETLRKADTYVEATGLVTEDEMLHHLVKNSTLLDLSHAANLTMQQPPNLSSILELSPILDKRAADESFFLSSPQPVSPLCSSPVVGPWKHFTSKNILGGEEKAAETDEKTPVTKRAVLFSPVIKKKISFKDLPGAEELRI